MKLIVPSSIPSVTAPEDKLVWNYKDERSAMQTRRWLTLFLLASSRNLRFFSPLGLTEDEHSPPRLQLILTQGFVRKFLSGHEAPGQFTVSISPSPPPTWTARRVSQAQHPFCSNTYSFSTHPFSAKLLGTFTSIYSWDEIYLPFQRWMNPMKLSSEL